MIKRSSALGPTLLNSGTPLSIVHNQRRHRLGPSKDMSCPKSTPPDLLGIDPQNDRLLSSAVSLVTFDLKINRASGYFLPKLLVARLRSLPQLEELTIEFSVPIPRPSTGRKLLGKQGTPVTLPKLKHRSVPRRWRLSGMPRRSD
jgi:hypothetical protein